MRALLVHDSAALKAFIQVALGRPDIEFDEASSPTDVAAAPDPHLAVVGPQFDLGLVVDAISILADRDPRPAIVALTSDPGPTQVETLQRAGADRVLTVPVAPNLLRSAACSSTQERGYTQ